MGTIANLANRFRALDFEQIKQQSLIETAPQIIPEMNEQQMRKGERSDGAEITPQLFDNRYAEIKVESGGQAPYKTPDLRSTGSFQDGLRTVVTTVSLKTYSIDLKADKLEKRYSPLIFGANAENLQIYAKENLLPELLTRLKAATVG